MSWGSWILLLVYPVSVVMIVLANRDRWWVNWYPPAERLVEPWWRTIAVGNIVIGALLGLYTGILLSGFTARPFWNNGILAPVFLVSGVSAGAAFMILFHDGSSVQEKADLGLIKLGLIGSELVALLLYFSSMATSAGNQREAIFSLLGGPYTATFWVFVVGVGLLVPLLLQTLEVLHLLESRYVMPVMVLVGGLALRILMINAGQASSVSRIVEVVQ
jgi:formate-dependent nitrite reductase membrane component NrfD